MPIYDVHGLLCGRGHLDVHGMAANIVDLAYLKDIKDMHNKMPT
jgi:hypothetical protein